MIVNKIFEAIDSCIVQDEREEDFEGRIELTKDENNEGSLL